MFLKIMTCISLFVMVSLTCHATVPADTVSSAGVSFQSAPNAKVSDGGGQKEVKKYSSQTAVIAPKRTVTKGLWAIFIAGFIGGLAAILMPCIFPMLPLTVSYFTKGDHSKGVAINKAILYGLSIIVIYVVLGLIITVVFGADALNNLATNGIFNFFFFLLLVVFAASFLGAFEILLPNTWINKMDSKTNGRGLGGLFFMAATLALVSFSCTGPIIGTLLVQAASTGALLSPAVGMLGFSLALSLPFVLFAMFPALLNSLPKSGGWLNSVKVFLGFLELALSLKFLSNVDLAYHWHWFDRELFLSLWIIIAVLAGFYLLGKLRLSHDSDLNYIGVPRLFLAIVVLSFTVYMVPGLWGAPLRSISAFLPPQDTQDFDLYTPLLTGNAQVKLSETDFPSTVKYQELFTAPLHLKAFFDYREGVAYARKIHKPVMIDFTGHACVNCRKMEATIWPDKTVFSLIKNSYVLIELYVDDKTELAPAEQYDSSFSRRHIATIGAMDSDLQAEKFNSNSQPDYVLLDPVTGQTLVPPQGAIYDVKVFTAYLQSALQAFK